MSKVVGTIETVVTVVLTWSALELISAFFGRGVAWIVGAIALVGLLALFWFEGGREDKKEEVDGRTG